MSANGRKVFFIGTSVVVLGAVTLGLLWIFSPQTVQKVLGPQLFGKLQQAADGPANAVVKAEDFHLLDQEGRIDLPILKDSAHMVVSSLGMERIGEVVGINTTNWTVFYRGAIDDRFA